MKIVPLFNLRRIRGGDDQGREKFIEKLPDILSVYEKPSGLFSTCEVVQSRSESNPEPEGASTTRLWFVYPISNRERSAITRRWRPWCL